MSDDQNLDISPEDEARIDAILRSMTADDLTLDTPPESVWAGIDAQTGQTAGADPAADEEPVAQVIDDQPVAPVVDDQPVAPVVDLAARRNRRLGIFAGAVAAAAALVVGISVIVSSDDPEFQEFASAELVFDPATFDPGGEGRSASTTLLVADDEEKIRFDAADLPEPVEGEDIELWLIGLDAADQIEIIQPIGLVDDLDEPGTFDVPAEFSFDDYATVAVDLSFEPRDGVETHSGRSILRGPLSA